MDDAFDTKVCKSFSTVKKKVLNAVQIMYQCNRLDWFPPDLDEAIDIVDFKSIPEEKIYLYDDQMKGKFR